MKWLLASALVGVACLCGAVTAAQAYDIVETRPIDKSFHVIRVRRENQGTGIYMVNNYFKVEERGGQLMVCGGYVGELNNYTLNTYSDALRNDSYLIIGQRDDASAPRLSSLAFMAENRTASAQLEDLKAQCILTEYPWQPQYGSHYWLHTGAGRGY